MSLTFKRRRPLIASLDGNNYRSKFEQSVAEALEELNVPYDYEAHRIEYEVPSRKAKYLPDFRLPNGIYIEAKGFFDAADRARHLLIKSQHPHLDIRFCFQRANTRLRKNSPTTYAAWCDKHGFQYCEKIVPLAWTKEKHNDTSSN